MPRIEIDSAELFNSRSQTVKDLMEPLCTKPYPHTGFLQRRVGKQKILGVGPGIQSHVHPDECWFRTFSDDIWCQYLEHWLPTDSRESRWFLESANMQVGMRDSESRAMLPIVMVHTEPNYDGEEPACTFKRSPHMHVSRAREREPIPHAHIPLNLGNIDQVLTSLADLTRAISDAVKIVRCEIVDPYAVEVFNFPKQKIPPFPWDMYGK